LNPGNGFAFIDPALPLIRKRNALFQTESPRASFGNNNTEIPAHLNTLLWWQNALEIIANQTKQTWINEN
jgi:hypothetical protein